MTTPISLQEMLKFILYLLGIGVLAYLLIFFKNLVEIFKKIDNIAGESQENIIGSIEDLNKITSNLGSITETANETLSSIAPEIDGIVHSTNEATGKIESITTVIDNAAYKVGETVDTVTDNINDAAYQMNENISSISGYLAILNEILEILKNILFNR